MKPLNILIIGAGSYTCGRGTDGYGTIMPAVCEWGKKGKLGEVYIAGKNPENVKLAKEKIKRLQRCMGVDILIRYFPEGIKKDALCYRKAIAELPRPACAIIATPDHTHREIAGKTIENDLHTLVAKPLAPTLRETQELINIQSKRDTYCAVEFHKRLDHANLMLKDIISSKKIGDPLYFLVEYSQRKSVPSRQFKEWVETTNIFQYLGIHYVDIIHFATGAVPKRAMAIGQKLWLRSKGIDTFDSVQGVIEWQGPSGKKFSSHILTNWVDPENTSAVSDQKIKVMGTKGRFESDQKKRGITIVTDNKGIEEPNPYFCAGYGDRHNTSYSGYGIDSVCQFLDDVVQIEEGIRKIQDLEDKRPTFKQSMIPTAVLEAVNRSLKNDGNWVTVKNI